MAQERYFAIIRCKESEVFMNKRKSRLQVVMDNKRRIKAEKSLIGPSEYIRSSNPKVRAAIKDASNSISDIDLNARPTITVVG